MKTYKEQAKEVKRLTERINKKAKNFCKEKHNSPYYGDMLHVIEELKDIDSFINDKYLKQ